MAKTKVHGTTYRHGAWGLVILKHKGYKKVG
jgi:hypothetical protein